VQRTRHAATSRRALTQQLPLYSGAGSDSGVVSTESLHLCVRAMIKPSKLTLVTPLLWSLSRSARAGRLDKALETQLTRSVATWAGPKMIDGSL